MSPQRSALLTAATFIGIAIPVSAIRPLWLDEILQLGETRQPSAIRMISDLRQTPGAVPLGYLVQWAALKIGGYSIILARLPSAIFGAGAVFLVALLGSQLGLKRGWQAGAVFAFLPLTLRYATESRVYSQALFFSVLATYFSVRLARRPTRVLAAQYWLALTAAVYTQPYSVCVGLAHLLCSATCRPRKTALLSGSSFALAMIAFLPWFWWARAGWSRAVALSGFHFSVSAKTPLMLFRELAGAGYWGSGILLLLSAAALTGGRLRICDRVLLALLIATVLASALSGDAWFDYFIAARQFIWLLPAVSILAAAGVECYPRAGLALAILLVIVCTRQSIAFFRSPGENWQMAANLLVEQVRQGNCLIVAPPEDAPLYEFFRPELSSAPRAARRIVLAITPAASITERRAAIDELISTGYDESGEQVVGRSEIIWFRR
jgi:4-amino-4-deoxy-L-arabinose transferase-like glycosyltransferase